MTSIRPMTEEERNRSKYRNMINGNSNATVSVKEYIAQAFDKFHNEVQFGRIPMSETMLTLINELEGQVIELATQQHTTEAEEIFEEGFEEGERSGYENGHTNGYEQAIYDYKVAIMKAESEKSSKVEV